MSVLNPLNIFTDFKGPLIGLKSIINVIYIPGTSFIYFGTGASCLLLGPPESNWCFSFAPELVGYLAPRDLHRRAVYSICESWFFIHQDVYPDLFVCS